MNSVKDQKKKTGVPKKAKRKGWGRSKPRVKLSEQPYPFGPVVDPETNNPTSQRIAELQDKLPAKLDSEDVRVACLFLKGKSKRSDQNALEIGWWIDVLHSRARKYLSELKAEFKSKTGMEYQQAMRKRRLYLTYGKSKRTVDEFLGYGEWVADVLHKFTAEKRKKIWAETGDWKKLRERLRKENGKKAPARVKIPEGASKPLMDGVSVSHKQDSVSVKFDLGIIDLAAVQKWIGRMQLGLVVL